MSALPPDRADLDELLAKVAATVGTPAYVYLTDSIEERLAQLKKHMGRHFTFSYAMKCNPNPDLLRWLGTRIELIDVSSIGEFRLARAAGWGADRISFTGPGKRDWEVEEAIVGGVGELVIESVREAVVADRIAQSHGLVQDILVRLSPSRVPKGFGDHMAGRPSQFGLDVETAVEDMERIMALPHLKIAGLHIYSGTQSLNPDAICENYRIFIDIFREVCEARGLTPRKLVFGSGLGIPYHEGDSALDLADVARGIAQDVSKMRAEERFRRSAFVLELGRYLVGESGYFLTRVISIKSSRGSRIAICDGGMNNHLAASGHFGMVVLRNFRMHRVGGGDDLEKVDLVGPLCTSIDRLAKGVVLPKLHEGDVVAVHASGAYGMTASPVHFISHPLPKEVLLHGSEIREVSGLLGGSEPVVDRFSFQWSERRDREQMEIS